MANIAKINPSERICTQYSLQFNITRVYCMSKEGTKCRNKVCINVHLLPEISWPEVNGLLQTNVIGASCPPIEVCSWGSHDHNFILLSIELVHSCAFSLADTDSTLSEWPVRHASSLAWNTKWKCQTVSKYAPLTCDKWQWNKFI